MKIYFVRHGKTEWNLEGRFQGQRGDSALLPEAFEDIQLLGEHLADVPFDRIFSSDLKRAHITAELIHQANHHSKIVETTPQLREWDFGRLEGTKIRLMQDIYPQQYTALKTNLAQFNSSMFEAETVYQATQRIIQFVKDLKDSQAETVLIVSHGAILTASIRSLLGFEPAQLRHRGGLDNASITVLETQDFEHFTELIWNDTSYKLTEAAAVAAS
ncbi:histidine phosphatase family protein [Streptococcus oriscaviae]|uniref:Histidine phosphatase family protein n=1 Tax=Streptococcus oriscaviae TaxID=2781599 RepID=A0ABX7YKD4_9STRE|nr:histidine phosphatase family protein [Streptococcus oriscaviae]QUE54268.1 histidine phosphatase family protein [Streptococcus oriscaviae]